MIRQRLGSLLVLGLLVATALPAMAMTETQSHDPRNLTWITPHVLAVGGGGLTTDDLAYLKTQGFGAVADFRLDHDDGEANVHAAGMDYIYIPVATAADITEPQLEQFVTWAQTEAAQGKPMYIHCSNGWHRAPTFAMAWLMVTEHLSFDDAATRVKDARDGVIVRAPAPLLAYQAKLTGQSGLVVDIEPASLNVPPGATQTLTIRVTSDGQPATAAKVHVWTEEPGFDTTVTTSTAGVATLPYTAPTGAPMQHLFARASLAGHADGAANPEITIQSQAAQVRSNSSPMLIGGIAIVALATASCLAWVWHRRNRHGRP